MLFTVSFLTLFLVNIKEILPSVFDKNQEVVVREDVINSKPYKILSEPTPQPKPTEKGVVRKKIEKTVELPTQGDSTDKTLETSLPENKDTTIKTP